MLKRSIPIIVFCLALLIPPVNAAPLDYDEGSLWIFESNQLLISIVNPGGGDVTFTGWSVVPQTNSFIGIGGTFEWSINDQQDRFYAASFDSFNTNWWLPVSNFGVTLSDDRNLFVMQYGYYLDGAPVKEQTLTWNPGPASGTGWWDTQDGLAAPFPTPISGSVWLMASGILALVGIRRRKSSNLKSFTTR